MTNSGLIVFLPLVAAFVGAIIGAWANSWYRNREAKKAEDRELKGLMILVGHEYANNGMRLLGYIQNPKYMDVPSMTNLRSKTWDDSKVRMAQLLPTDHLTMLSNYYANVEDVSDILRDNTLSPEEKAELVRDTAKTAQQYGKSAIEFAVKFAFADDPEYAEQLKRMQNVAQLFDERLDAT